MRICAISIRIGSALRDMGHEVLNLWPSETLFDLEAALAERSFTPELIFQEESLGPRVILGGLARFSCPKIFWSLDTHLNWHWQRFYCRLFDGVLTPHMGILEKQPRPPGQALGRMAMFGADRPWRPFAERGRDLGFVGRVTESRPVRGWLVQFLTERYGAAIAQDLTFPEMLDFYCATRLAPNEALLSEVNFRLVEAASCGCLVLSQDVGPDQDALFARGREIETYGHVLELESLLDHYLARPDEAESLGRAAWERVQREHLVAHRCAAMLDFASGLTHAAARGAQAETAYWLSLTHLQRAGMFAATAQGLGQNLARLPQAPEVLAARLTLLVENASAGCSGEAALALARQILAEGAHADQLEVNLAGSMAALFLDDWSLARQFWRRHEAATGQKPAPQPESPAKLCLLWAKVLTAAERFGSAGFPFDPATRLPRAAVECLYLAQRLDPEDIETTRRLAAQTASLRGHDFTRLGQLSTLALHRPGDWRTGLQLGMAGLKTYRREAGLEEIVLALGQAQAQGKVEGFLGTLAALDPGGGVLAELRKRGVA
ncbi:glycosyltransferase family protein [Humidesulfovibrio idahonensis]